MTKIYVLRDPRTNDIRYVGQTRSPLPTRLSTHVAQAKRQSCWREKWIWSLLQENLRPVIELLEEVESDQAGARERYWIAKLAETCRLTNATKGGEGFDLLPEAEQRRLTNSAWYRKALTPEAKAIRSAAAAKRWQGLSPEQRQEIIHKASAAASARPTRKMDLSSTEIQRRQAHGRALGSRFRASFTETEWRARQAEVGRKNRGYTWTPEQRQAASERRKLWWASLSETERDAFNQRRLAPRR